MMKYTCALSPAREYAAHNRPEDWVHAYGIFWYSQYLEG